MPKLPIIAVVLISAILVSVLRHEDDESQQANNKESGKFHERKERPSTSLSREGSKRILEEQPIDLKSARADDWLDPEQRVYLLTALVEWSADHRDDAINYLATIPESVRTEASCELAGALLEKSPDQSWAILETLPMSPLTDQMMQQCAAEFASKSPDRAIEWALAQTDTNERTKLFSAVLCAHASEQPAEAARLAVEHLPAGREQDQLFVEITQRWVQIAPQAAANFATTLSGDAAHDAVKVVVSLWPSEQLAELHAWYAGLPDGAAKMTARDAMPALEK